MLHGAAGRMNGLARATGKEIAEQNRHLERIGGKVSYSLLLYEYTILILCRAISSTTKSPWTDPSWTGFARPYTVPACAHELSTAWRCQAQRSHVCFAIAFCSGCIPSNPVIIHVHPSCTGVLGPLLLHCWLFFFTWLANERIIIHPHILCPGSIHYSPTCIGVHHTTYRRKESSTTTYVDTCIILRRYVWSIRTL